MVRNSIASLTEHQKGGRASGELMDLFQRWKKSPASPGRACREGGLPHAATATAGAGHGPRRSRRSLGRAETAETDHEVRVVGEIDQVFLRENHLAPHP